MSTERDESGDALSSREAMRLAADRAIYGTSFETPEGVRIDPNQIRPAMPSGDTIELLRAQVARLQAQLLAIRNANSWCESKHCKRTAVGYAEDADGMRWLACAQHGGKPC